METIEDYENMAFEIFAKLHPIEAFETYPAKFEKYLKKEGYDITTNQIEIIIKELNKVELIDKQK